jgi:hypothetical protein
MGLTLRQIEGAVHLERLPGDVCIFHHKLGFGLWDLGFEIY